MELRSHSCPSIHCPHCQEIAARRAQQRYAFSLLDTDEKMRWCEDRGIYDFAEYCADPDASCSGDEVVGLVLRHAGILWERTAHWTFTISDVPCDLSLYWRRADERMTPQYLMEFPVVRRRSQRLKTYLARIGIDPKSRLRPDPICCRK